MSNTGSPPPSPLVAVDDDLIEPVAKLCAGLDVSLASDEDLFSLAVSLERGRALTDAAECAVLAELDARGATDIEFGHRTGRWLAVQSKVAPSTAKQRVSVGVALRRWFPEMWSALVDGRISFDHCAVWVKASNVRIVDAFAEFQGEAIDTAQGLTFGKGARYVGSLAALLDQDGSYDPASDVENNRLSLRPTPEGITVSGGLVGEWAQIVKETISQVADEIFRRHLADREVLGDDAPPIPTWPVLRALALAEVCRRAQGTDVTDGTSAKPKVEATLILPGNDLADIRDTDGQPIPGLDVLTCDISILTILSNSMGIPLDMGREVRTANRAQRRALAFRDGGCCFPGCGVHAAWTDAHHLVHWRNGGPTTITNMALFCRHHHGVIHRNGWGATIDDHGWVTITTPSGRVLDGQRHGNVRARP